MSLSKDLLTRLASVVWERIRSPALDVAYDWKVSQRAWTKLPNFKESTLPEPERNVALRNYLAGRWADANLEGRIELANWIVNDWGGIKGNKHETLTSHVLKTQASDLNLPFEGIATYSKIFSIADPDRYAIYDARVATALNAIQLLQNVPLFMFPIPPGRNKEIDQPKTKQGFSDIYTRKKLMELGFAAAPRRDTYKIYLQLVCQLKQLSGWTLLLLEMELFARATSFSKEVRQARIEIEN
jgi:hypothetical protein